MKPRGLTLRMLAASALLVAVVAVVFTVLLSAIGDLRGSTHWTEHSVAVLGASGELQNELSDLTSATRTYVDVPSGAPLQRWQALRAQVPTSAAHLQAMWCGTTRSKRRPPSTCGTTSGRSSTTTTSR